VSEKYTPGPWRWLKASSANGPKTDGLYGPNNEPVVEGRWCNDGTADAEPSTPANGALISAAPDLLEALKSIENDDERIPASIWEMRNAAISKAEGTK